MMGFIGSQEHNKKPKWVISAHERRMRAGLTGFMRRREGMQLKVQKLLLCCPNRLRIHLFPFIKVSALFSLPGWTATRRRWGIISFYKNNVDAADFIITWIFHFLGQHKQPHEKLNSNQHSNSRKRRNLKVALQPFAYINLSRPEPFRKLLTVNSSPL